MTLYNLELTAVLLALWLFASFVGGCIVIKLKAD